MDEKNQNEEILKRNIESGVISCMAMCRLVYIHGKEVGFNEQQAMMMAGLYLTSVLGPGKEKPGR